MKAIKRGVKKLVEVLIKFNKFMESIAPSASNAIHR